MYSFFGCTVEGGGSGGDCWDYVSHVLYVCFMLFIINHVILYHFLLCIQHLLRLPKYRIQTIATPPCPAAATTIAISNIQPIQIKPKILYNINSSNILQ